MFILQVAGFFTCDFRVSIVNNVINTLFTGLVSYRPIAYPALLPLTHSRAMIKVCIISSPIESKAVDGGAKSKEGLRAAWCINGTYRVTTSATIVRN